MNKAYFIVKKAMSPGVAALISAGIGSGIGYGIDSWRAANGEPPENSWIGPLLMATVTSTPAIVYGIARHSYDTNDNGEHSIPLLQRWFMNDKDFFSKSKYAIPNIRNYIKEQEKLLPIDTQIARQKAGKPNLDIMNTTNTKNASFPAIGDIPVNDFNQEIWLDASRGRTPLEAAGFASSMLNQTAHRTGSGLVSPGQVINTMVNAGIGYGTAWLAGKTLGALAGVSPATQNKLQEIGTWGGILGGIQNAASHY